LIEAVAEQIASRILSEQPLVDSITVRVQKPGVPIPGSVLASSEVTIERSR
jgi:dihydroneopterin aldolase